LKVNFAFITALALTGFAFQATAAEPMSFRLMPLERSNGCERQCAQAIVADGEIVNSTPQEFLAFVSSNLQANLSSVVLLNSPGGKVLASMELGQAFRKRGMVTIVAGVQPSIPGAVAAARCYSACVYALMGGRKRVIPPQSEVGIHRMFQYESALDPAAGIATLHRRYDTGTMRAILSRYSNRMGVNSGIIDYAERLSTDSIHVLSRKEIARWGLGQSKL
jgi:hypothetical protein